jgi:hypothetical protein
VGDVAAIVNVATIANTKECNNQLRDCNPNPPSAKRQAHFGNGGRGCDQHLPYGVKKFVAQPGPTTNDKSTCERKGGGKEQASTKQKGSPRHFVTYPVRNEIAAI